ncbi:MAG: metallophosphoesterase, partial [Acidobacteria bacterium]|nr:metallophosphoesterase [Acidobacteriota bacterium]
MRNRLVEKRSLAVLLSALLFALTLFASNAEGQTAGVERARVTIISTTDLHGNILPVDYYTNKPDERGLAKAATLIRAARKENPELLLIDSGDTIQGTPLEYVHNKKNNAPPDPMMLAMNALKYDAMTIGNHEYNFGLKVFEKARGEAKFPWLSANTYRKGTDQTAFTPYIIKMVGGVKVGILGLTTPGIPGWENVENYEGLEFREPVSEAEKWVKILREKERVDLVVIAMHMGLERDLRTGETNPGQQPNENMALAIAERVQGIDVILMGHTHREIPSLYLNQTSVNGVLLTQADSWGHVIARVDVYLEKDSRGWSVTSKAARTIPVTDKVEVDAEIAKIAEPYDKETQAWLSR